MKGISFLQPVANLIAIGALQIAPQKASTSFRGPMAMHALKKWSKHMPDELDFCKAVLAEQGFVPPSDRHAEMAKRPYSKSIGCIVAVANLVDVFRYDSSKIDPLAKALRVFDGSGFCCVFQDVKPLLNPYPIQGKSAVAWEIEPAAERSILALSEVIVDPADLQALLSAGWKKSFFENDHRERLWHPPGESSKDLVPESLAVLRLKKSLLYI